MWSRRDVLAAGLAASVTRSASAAASHMLTPFRSSPFPYDGRVPGTGQPFLDVERDGRRGHNSPRGGIYLEDETYSDRRVLLALSHPFVPGRGAIVVFLHGNLARLERDVVQRQKIVAQFLASRFDGALVAPQFAVDALDSSAGHFWDQGAFARFLDEAAETLAARSSHGVEEFARLPVILVAYSGGYNPAAAILSRGGADARIAGLILMDALYGEEQTFCDWLVAEARRVFFFSAYSPSSAAGNVALRAALAGRGVAAGSGMPARLSPGTVSFLETGPVVHNDFMTRAWAPDPLRLVLSRVALGRVRSER